MREAMFDGLREVYNIDHDLAEEAIAREAEQAASKNILKAKLKFIILDITKEKSMLDGSIPPLEVTFKYGVAIRDRLEANKAVNFLDMLSLEELQLLCSEDAIKIYKNNGATVIELFYTSKKSNFNLSYLNTPSYGCIKFVGLR